MFSEYLIALGILIGGIIGGIIIGLVIFVLLYPLLGLIVSIFATLKWLLEWTLYKLFRRGRERPYLDLDPLSMFGTHNYIDMGYRGDRFLTGGPGCNPQSSSPLSTKKP